MKGFLLVVLVIGAFFWAYLIVRAIRDNVFK